MRRLIDISVRRPVAVAMGFCGLALLAWAAVSELAVDVVPRGEFPQLTVQAGWPGASPEAMQSRITSPIEAVAITVPGVRKVSSQSQRGTAMVTLELAEEASVDLVRFELSDRLALLQEELPPGASQPEIQSYVPREFQEMTGGVFLSFTLRGPRDLNALRRIALEQVRDELLPVPGVAQVIVHGGQDPHVRVTLDPQRLELHGVHSAQVLGAVRELAGQWPVGVVEVGGTAYTLRIEQRIEDLRPLRQLPITGGRGEELLLSDLGRVELTYDEVREISRVNGEPLVQVQVERRPGTDVLGVAAGVRERLARLQQRLPSDLTIEVQQDEAAELEAELDLVTRRLAIVLALVIGLIVVLLRDIHSAPLLVAALAGSLAITLVALVHLGIPVNVLTLTGLALAFGMLVDNAVVVLENVTRYREDGLGAREAARRGTSEVVLPVLAATLTTIGVFFPFVWFQGRLRDYFLPLAAAVGLALAASLVVSMTLMPAAAGSGWLGVRARHGHVRARWFRKGLGLCLRFPIVVLLLVGAAWYASYAQFDEHVPRGDFFRWWGAREDRINVQVTLQSGAPATRTEAALRPFEEYALGLDGVERLELRVTDYRGSLEVRFTPESTGTAYPLVVKDEMIGLATRYAGLQIGVFGIDQNGYFSGWRGGGSLNSRIHLYGYDYERLGQIGEEIGRMARRSARVQETNVTAGGTGFWGDQGGELVMRVKRDALLEHGLTVQELQAQLAPLLSGRTGQDRLRVGADEWTLQVKVEGADQRLLTEVLEAPIRAADGRGARVGDLVEVTLQQIPGIITREDQRYDRFAQWEYRGSSRASANYRRAIFESLDLPPGFSASLDDDFRLTREEQIQIRQVTALALVIVFMVLASLYESLLQPFIVLLTVPASLIGVFLAFLWAERSFDAAASIGVVLLGGIVVNNAILLVDHINLRRGQLPLREAIVTATAERLRPILITSITTVGGMLPLVLVTPEEQTRTFDIWGSLALSAIGGLTAATVLTLTVTPVLYLLAERGRGRAQSLARRIARVWRELPV